MHRGGDFLDVGCANGLLLESVIGWARERSFTLKPHGIDFVPELVALAQRRFPNERDSFSVANAFYWEPTRTYDFVRTNLEYTPRADWVEFARRQFAAGSAGGRLILCHYRNTGEAEADVAAVLSEAGLDVSGRSAAPNVDVAWAERTRVQLRIELSRALRDQIEPLRARWNPERASDNPAHVTLIYHDEATSEALLRARIAAAAMEIAPFDLMVGSPRRFEPPLDGIYLAAADPSNAASRRRARTTHGANSRDFSRRNACASSASRSSTPQTKRSRDSRSLADRTSRLAD